MANEIPPTQKGQIDALLAALGVSDFTAAVAAIPQLRSSAESAVSSQQALFAAIGGSGTVPEHYDFAASITGLRGEQQALFAALGVTDQAGAVEALGNITSQLNSLRANQTTIFAALGATDLAGAMRAIKDIDGRIEAGVQAGVIARAASAGLNEPVKKEPGEATGGAQSVTRAVFADMNAKQQLEFSKAGGKLID